MKFQQIEKEVSKDHPNHSIKFFNHLLQIKIMKTIIIIINKAAQESLMLLIFNLSMI